MFISDIKMRIQYSCIRSRF